MSRKYVVKLIDDRVVSPSNSGRCWNVQSNVAMLLLTWVIPFPLQETQRKQPNIEVKKTNKNQTESLIAHDPSMLSNYSIDLVRGPAALCRVFKTTLPVDAYRFQTNPRHFKTRSSTRSLSAYEVHKYVWKNRRYIPEKREATEHSMDLIKHLDESRKANSFFVHMYRIWRLALASYRART
jgi:hypothetical protein